jgi:hypothetical protein
MSLAKPDMSVGSFVRAADHPKAAKDGADNAKATAAILRMLASVIIY